MTFTLSQIIDVFFLSYLVLINLYYLSLNSLSLVEIIRGLIRKNIMDKNRIIFGVEPPISILVPAYNEEEDIIRTIQSLLSLKYSEYEIVVINDGSTDGTLDVLMEKLDLIRNSYHLPIKLKTKSIKGVYVSNKYPTVRVIDKVNGGKSDALNAGINFSRFPLFASVDADSILKEDSLYKVGVEFLHEPNVIAAGGTIRPSNGCKIINGRLTKIGLPKTRMGMIQIVEYLRAFLFGRLGFTTFNGILILSGAFAVFKKSIVVEVGGYKADTIGEDMELVLRLHKFMRFNKRPYRIVHVPEPVCWTEVPENLKALQAQRIRWYRGSCESLFSNLKLLFHPRSGSVGWLALPSFIFFEWLDPFIYLFGFLWMGSQFILGNVAFEVFAIFIFLAFSLGLLQSVNCFILEELFFRIFTKPKNLIRLFFASVIENLGYRQLNTVWRFMGLVNWMIVRKNKWGYMVRNKVEEAKE